MAYGTKIYLSLDFVVSCVYCMLSTTDVKSIWNLDWCLRLLFVKIRIFGASTGLQSRMSFMLFYP